MRVSWLYSSFGRSLLLVCLFQPLLITSFASHATAGQNKSNLISNQPLNFTLNPGEKKTFVLQLKENDFAEISWQADESLSLSFKLYDPSGKDLLEEVVDVENSIPFVAPKSGDYTLVVKLDQTEGVTGGQNITLQYSDKLKLPPKITSTDVRKINGYDVKILSDEEGKSYLLIEKEGRLNKILKGGGYSAAHFNFLDDLTQAESAEEKREAMLAKNTPDKTGDGVPDVAVRHYSGGAHCCFTLLIFELGETVKELPPLSTGNTDVSIIGKNPKGGLRLETYDDNFAYWLTSFAGSPMPRVVLEFNRGALRPNFQLMKKPAPSLVKLRSMARGIRGKISLTPYEGSDNSSFDVVFWDVMLDLIYTGHEQLAWQYLDLVWPAQKKGKAIFVKDFKEQLSKSQFWQMIIEDNKLPTHVTQ